MDLSSFTPGSALITVILLALAPFVAVMVTSFTKIVVTLSLLRNALGLQQVPPNIVLNGLALILTLYVMYPVGQQMAAANQDVKPVAAVSSDTQALFTYADKAKEPLRAFLMKHSTPRERAFFLKTAQRINGPDKARAMTQRDFIVVVPAFTVSELAAAFQIGFLIFLPFLIIDLVVSNILLAMGMMMLSPTTVSLPFKLLLFVLIDGWVKLAHGLVLSYT
ncbi:MULTISPECIES: type III secretion system export apparatus subunit SctR [Caulobacter]|jgi:type III secretion protein R|uniref:Type III secretion protein R n=1 Tax=Caulobacter rhizosphaerae TaxID=2010972 RepID=A0ABU1N233_9CAUL|nr:MULTISPECIES: type III secretion system export apparatus subunit SctR [Caulobacter]KQZ29096.1 type III secretion system protein SsaR [Caulobacter sp. Root1472]MDR6532521.1 type III secretion protein R [Caulobacter rhizosphaerae]GGL11267.1 EscR/YscR/HrcR family type III secretion system export apparatus protein [Caulobacter rhizosphaerae]